jgi:hypothetical protein
MPVCLCTIVKEDTLIFQ